MKTLTLPCPGFSKKCGGLAVVVVLPCNGGSDLPNVLTVGSVPVVSPFLEKDPSILSINCLDNSL